MVSSSGGLRGIPRLRPLGEPLLPLGDLGDPRVLGDRGDPRDLGDLAPRALLGDVPSGDFRGDLFLDPGGLPGGLPGVPATTTYTS